MGSTSKALQLVTQVKKVFVFGAAGNNSWEADWRKQYPGEVVPQVVRDRDNDVLAPGKWVISVGTKSWYVPNTTGGPYVPGYVGFYKSSHKADLAVADSLLMNPGTSFATAWISGSAYSLLSVDPNLNQQDMLELLRRQGYDKPSFVWNYSAFHFDPNSGGPEIVYVGMGKVTPSLQNKQLRR